MQYDFLVKQMIGPNVTPPFDEAIVIDKGAKPEVLDSRGCDGDKKPRARVPIVWSMAVSAESRISG